MPRRVGAAQAALTASRDEVSEARAWEEHRQKLQAEVAKRAKLAAAVARVMPPAAVMIRTPRPFLRIPYMRRT